MTNACGFGNSASLYPGQLSMTQLYYNSSKKWTASYTASPSILFGKAISYPNQTQYWSRTSNFKKTVDLSKSMTMFAYFSLTSRTANFSILEFDTVDTTGQSTGQFSFFSYLAGGLYYYFSKSN